MSIFSRLIEKEDQKLVCYDCSNVFYHTIQEQTFFKQKNFETPKRCLFCRRQKKNRTLQIQAAIIGILKKVR